MRSPAADPDALNVVCGGCGQRVRFARKRLEDEPLCPSCKHPLLSGVPVVLDQANFDRYLRYDDLPMLVDFWAQWCGPCQSFAPVLSDVASEFRRSLRVGKVDTDASPELGSRFGIRSIPTIVLFKAGSEIARQSGAVPKSALLGWLGGHGLGRNAA